MDSVLSATRSNWAQWHEKTLQLVELPKSLEAISRTRSWSLQLKVHGPWNLLSDSLGASLLRNSRVGFPPVSFGSAWTLPSPDFLGSPRRTLGLRSAGSTTWPRQHLLCKVRGERGPPPGSSGSADWPGGLKLRPFFSPVSTITLEAFSRALQGLLLALWCPRPAPAAPHAENCLPAACGFHGDGACTDREGEADANGAVEPDHRITASDSSRQSATGTGRQGKRQGRQQRWKRETLQIGKRLSTGCTVSTK